MAILWRENQCTLREIGVRNPGRFEVLVAAGSVKGNTRKLVIIAAYIPPGYAKREGEAALSTLRM